jgi:CopG family nickel-responsive transcriptional regulator
MAIRSITTIIIAIPARRRRSPARRRAGRRDGRGEGAKRLVADGAASEVGGGVANVFIRCVGKADDMERVTISMSDEFAAELAAFMEDYHYENRSEALRDLARLGLEKARIDHSTKGQCVATLSYVFNHHTRELAKRLTDAHHDHHDLQVATMHVHLDHDNCLEVAVLRGAAAAVRDFAKAVIAERSVKYGQVSFVPVAMDNEAHAHTHDGAPHAHPHPHLHAHPKD